MQLVINTYGSYLRKSGDRFLVRKDDRNFEVAVSETAAAHPAAELAGHPRRRRIKMETGS
jgi:hypothetical protein